MRYNINLNFFAELRRMVPKGSTYQQALKKAKHNLCDKSKNVKRLQHGANNNV